MLPELGSLPEKRLKITLSVVLVLLILSTAYGAWSLSRINPEDGWTTSNLEDSVQNPMSARGNAQGTAGRGSANQSASDYQNGGAALVPQALTGTVVFLGPDNSFIRIANADNTLYSVGIDADTKITRAGAAFDIGTIEPHALVAITALDLPNTEMYDFLAQSIEITSPIEMTVEERVERLSKLGKEKSLSF